MNKLTKDEINFIAYVINGGLRDLAPLMEFLVPSQKVLEELAPTVSFDAYSTSGEMSLTPDQLKRIVCSSIMNADEDEIKKILIEFGPKIYKFWNAIEQVFMIISPKYKEFKENKLKEIEEKIKKGGNVPGLPKMKIK